MSLLERTVSTSALPLSGYVTLGNLLAPYELQWGTPYVVLEPRPTLPLRHHLLKLESIAYSFQDFLNYLLRLWFWY